MIMLRREPIDGHRETLMMGRIAKKVLTSLIAVLVATSIFPLHPQEIDGGVHPSDESVQVVDDVPSTPVDMPDIAMTLNTRFIENEGQVSDPAVRYYAIGDQMSIGLTPDGLVFEIYVPNYDTLGIHEGKGSSTCRMTFGGSGRAEPSGVEPYDHPLNFITGNEPERWRAGVESFHEVLYEDIWDGVDLRCYFSEGLFKYDLMVEPGKDPKSISMQFTGQMKIEVEKRTGDLLLHTEQGTLRDTKPLTYQMIDGETIEVSSDFDIRGKGIVGFTIGMYDPSLPLIIDPGLSFSTYIGGTGSGGSSRFGDQPFDMRTDTDGHVYIVGWTYSPDFPTTASSYDTSLNTNSCDAFIVKLDSNGTKIHFGTYLGGTEQEIAFGVEIDSAQNIYVTGLTESNDFPTTRRAYDTLFGGNADIFLSKLNSQGSILLYSTYIGGTARDYSQAMRIDDAGNLYISGSTHGVNFPTTPNAFDRVPNGRDVFVLKFNISTSSLLYSTYLGGTSDDYATQLEIDEEGYAYVVGATSSNDFPTTQGAYNITYGGGYHTFLTKVNGQGSALNYSTFIFRGLADILAGPNGTLYGVGGTSSSTFPVTADAYDPSHNGNSDACIFRLDATGSKIEYATFIGGSLSDMASSIWVDDEGYYYITGYTNSTDFPTTSNAYCSTIEGDSDIFVMMINKSLDVHLYSTFIGGTDSDQPFGIATSEKNMTVMGSTQSSDFPTTQWAFDRTYGGHGDAVAFRIGAEAVVPTAPSSPHNFMVHPGDGYVDLTWLPPDTDGGANLLGYHIMKGTNETALAVVPVKEGIIFLRDNDVVNGVTYYYKIHAFNWIGNSSASPLLNATPGGTPSAPLGLRAMVDDHIMLNWTTPIDDGGRPILGYRLYRGTDLLTQEHLVDLGVVTECEDEDVEVGKISYYKVQAFNILGNGTFSKLISCVPVGPPSEPLLLHARQGEEGILLDWRPPSNDGGKPILGYRVLRGLAADDLTSYSEEPFMTSFTDIDIEVNVTFYYQIIAFNGLGEGPPSNMVNITMIGESDEVTNPIATPGVRSISLDWEPCLQDGGSPVIHYIVRWGPNIENMDEAIEPVSTTSLEVSNLDNGTTYYFRISAVNDIGEGPGVIVYETTFDMPGAVEDLSITSSDGELNLFWSRPEYDGGSPITLYHLYRGTSEDQMVHLTEVGPETTRYLDTPLMNGQSYHYRITAETDVGEGPMGPIVPATPKGPPGPPLNPEAIHGDGLVELTWGPPEDDGGSTITGYKVFRGTSVDELMFLLDLGPQTELTDGDLENGVTYHYAIVAMNDIGTGSQSVTVEAMPKAALKAPTEPMGLHAEQDGSSVILTWEAPVSDGGTPILGYVVLLGLSRDRMEPIHEVTGQLSYTDEGLKRGTTYFYSVVARNGVGEGHQSEVIEIHLKERKEDTPTIGVSSILLAIALMVIIARKMKDRT